VPPAPQAVPATEAPAAEAPPAPEVPPAPVEAPVQKALVQEVLVQEAPLLAASAPSVAAAPKKPRGWSITGIVVAAAIAVTAGLAFPEVEHQWIRFSSVEALPIVKPKPPAPPVLPQISEAQKPTGPSATDAVVKTVAARSSEPFIGPLIPLEVPAKVKSQVQSEVRVDVVVAIDPDGNVTGARNQGRERRFARNRSASRRPPVAVSSRA
jgi:hypothetical protein